MKAICTTIFLSVCMAVSLHGASKPDVGALIHEADDIIFYSLEPQQVYSADLHGNPTEEDKKKERLHGYPVLGKIASPDKKTSMVIRGAFVEALTSAAEGPSYFCFDPRHALCLKKKDQHVDLLICFECGGGYAFYFDGEEQKKEFIGIGPAGQVELNQLLDSRRILRDIPKKEPAQPRQHNASTGSALRYESSARWSLKKVAAISWRYAQRWIELAAGKKTVATSS